MYLFYKLIIFLKYRLSFVRSFSISNNYIVCRIVCFHIQATFIHLYCTLFCALWAARFSSTETVRCSVISQNNSFENHSPVSKSIRTRLLCCQLNEKEHSKESRLPFIRIAERRLPGETKPKCSLCKFIQTHCCWI